MEVKLKFTDDDARQIEWLLRRRYRSKAELPRLILMAVREVAAQEAALVMEENRREVKEG